jgi:hypothetical protein
MAPRLLLLEQRFEPSENFRKMTERIQTVGFEILKVLLALLNAGSPL